MSLNLHSPQLGLQPGFFFCNFYLSLRIWVPRLPEHLYWRLRVKRIRLWFITYELHTILTNGINWLFGDLYKNLFWDSPQSIFDSRSLGVCLFFRGVVYKIFSGWVVIEVQLYLANKTERIIRIVDSRAFSVLCKPKVPYH